MGSMRLLYYWETVIGTFYIAESRGRFHPVYDEESLGSYARPDQAAQDLAGGHTFSIFNGLDTTMLGIPDDLRQWHRCAGAI